MFEFPKFRCKDCGKLKTHYVKLKSLHIKKIAITKKYCDECSELRVYKNHKKSDEKRRAKKHSIHIL